MNSWFLIRRLRGPAFLILVGFTALLNQWGVLSFSHSWPLYLILAGVFGLAERAVMANTALVPPPMYPTYPPYSAAYVPPAYPVSNPAPPAPVATPVDPNADPNAGRDRSS